MRQPIELGQWSSQHYDSWLIFHQSALHNLPTANKLLPNAASPRYALL